MPTTTPIRPATIPAAPARRLPAWLPLLALLGAQAVASGRLLRADTAYTDEALYLWAGRAEWAHVLAGTPMPAPAFPAYFSGSPLIYPPLGAIASGIGGLAGARLLSLAFMLGCTALLWDATRRLYGSTAAFFAAAAFALLGPVIHLGAFATYDPMALFLLALSAWLVVHPGPRADGIDWWVIGGALVLALADLAKYAALLFDPVVVALCLLVAIPETGSRYARTRMAYLAAFTALALVGFGVVAAYGNGDYARGFEQTTLFRPQGDTPVLAILRSTLTWIWPVMLVGAFAVLLGCLPGHAAARLPHWSHRLLICVLAGACLLAPLGQARIHTVTSLEKHVAYGAWFTAIACGWVAAEFLSRLPAIKARAAAWIGVAFSAAVLASGIPVSVSLTQWANASPMVAALRPVLPGSRGHALIQMRAIAEYYLGKGADGLGWSNLNYVILPSGRVMSQAGGAAVPAARYLALIRAGYFRVVELNDIHYSRLEEAIAGALGRDRAYRVAAGGSYGPGRFTVWVSRA